MKPEKLFFPLMVFAAVLGVWFWLKPKGPATVVQPNTSQSGVPGYYAQSPAQYSVGQPQLTPSPLVMLANPLSNDPYQKQPEKPPFYLAFNFGPSHDLTKAPAAAAIKDAAKKSKKDCGGDCGCCGGCGDSQNNMFPDGRGRTPMASTFGRMVNNTPQIQEWISIAEQNFSETNIYPAPPPAPSISTPSPAGVSSVGFTMAPQHANTPAAFGPGVF